MTLYTFLAGCLHASYAVEGTRFLVLGDWGGVNFFPYRTAVEESVAKQMGNIADRYAPQFILALGDNFYFDGVKDVSDARFKVYIHTLLRKDKTLCYIFVGVLYGFSLDKSGFWLAELPQRAKRAYTLAYPILTIFIMEHISGMGRGYYILHK